MRAAWSITWWRETCGPPSLPPAAPSRPPHRLDGDLLGDDPAAAYAASAAAAAAVFRRPGALDAPCAVSYGPVPGSVYAGHRFLDVLVHGWDLAVATGQDYALDPS